MIAKERIKVPRTVLSTARAGLASHIRVDKDNSLAFPSSLVFDKTLQLIEAPAIEPSIQSLAHKFIPTFSYVFQVLQYDCISRSNNLFADCVVNSSHVTFLFARDSFELSRGRLRAFTLEFSPQILVLNDFGFVSSENLAITTYSKIIYSDIHTDDSVATTRSDSMDISGESDMEEHSSFSVFDNFKSFVPPIKIFPIVFRNSYGNIFPLSWGEGSNPNLFKRENKKLSIKTDRAGFHNGLLFELDGLKIFRSLCNSFTSKISRKPLSQVPIDKMVELKPITYFGFKTFINSILNSLKKGLGHIKQFFIMLNFQFYRSNSFHNSLKDVLIYKSYAQMSSVQCNEYTGGESQFPQLAKASGTLEPIFMVMGFVDVVCLYFWVY